MRVVSIRALVARGSAVVFFKVIVHHWFSFLVQLSHLSHCPIVGTLGTEGHLGHYFLCFLMIR
jgi:hypothetical protein